MRFTGLLMGLAAAFVATGASAQGALPDRCMKMLMVNTIEAIQQHCTALQVTAAGQDTIVTVRGRPDPGSDSAAKGYVDAERNRLGGLWCMAAKFKLDGGGPALVEPR